MINYDCDEALDTASINMIVVFIGTSDIGFALGSIAGYTMRPRKRRGAIVLGVGMCIGALALNHAFSEEIKTKFNACIKK
jgi:hypothetical protein